MLLLLKAVLRRASRASALPALLLVVLMSPLWVATASPDDAYWLSLTEQSIFFFDDTSQRLYMYPNSLTSYDQGDYSNVSCFYVETEPTTFAKPPLGAIYYRNAADVAANASSTWNDTIMTTNAPPFFLRSQQSLYIPEKRALVVLGGYEFWQASTSTSTPSSEILESCMSWHGWATNGTQCLVPHPETYILWLENMTWSTFPYETASFPAVDNATLLADGALAMFQVRLSLTYDWLNDRLFAFGGYLDGLDFTYCNGSPYFYPVWMFSFGTKSWTRLSTTNGVCIGFAAFMDPLRGMFVYNPLKNQLVTYSGTDNWEGFTSWSCFILDIDTLSWSQSAICAPFSGPTAAFDAAYFYSPDHRGVYLAGGQYNPPGAPGWLYWAATTVWFLDFEDYTWNIAPLPTTLPMGVQFSQMKTAINPTASIVYMWGGAMSRFPPTEPWMFAGDYACLTKTGGFWTIQAQRVTDPNTIFTISWLEHVQMSKTIPGGVRIMYVALLCMMFLGCCLGIYSLRFHQNHVAWASLETHAALLPPQQSNLQTSTGTLIHASSITDSSLGSAHVGVLEVDVGQPMSRPGIPLARSAAAYSVISQRSSRERCKPRGACSPSAVLIAFVVLTKGCFLISHFLDLVFRVYEYSIGLAVIYTLCILTDAVTMSLVLFLSSSWPSRPPTPAVRLSVCGLFLVSVACVVCLCSVAATRQVAIRIGWPAIGWLLLTLFLISSLLTRIYVIQNDIYSRLYAKCVAMASAVHSPTANLVTHELISSDRE